jgi:hypothetical protein
MLCGTIALLNKGVNPMKKHKVIQSPNPDTDTLKCPKCNALWRAKGHYNYDEGGWAYDADEEYCPKGCKNFIGFRVKGKLTSN